MSPVPKRHRPSLPPPDALSMIFSHVGSRDALSAARASPLFFSALTCKLSSVTWTSGSATHLASLHGHNVGTAVRQLSLGHSVTRITPAAAAAIAKACPHLTSLVLRGVHAPHNDALHGMHDDALHALVAHAPTLADVRVEFCGSITGAGFAHAVRAGRSLARLTCKYSGGLRDADVAAIAAATRGQLVELDIEYNVRVGDGAMRALADHCPALAILSLAGCARVSDAGLALVAKSLGHALRALDIRDLPLVTDTGVWAVAAMCPSVEYMNLWRLRILSYAVCAVAEACGGSLRILILGESEDLDDEALFSIAEQCEVLGDLEISRLAQVTDAGLAAFLAPGAVPWLKRIVVKGCQRLSDGALLQLERKEGLEVSVMAVRKVGVAELRKR